MSLPVKIGNYRFERNLGNGTFGKVKRKCDVPPGPRRFSVRHQIFFTESKSAARRLAAML